MSSRRSMEESESLRNEPGKSVKLLGSQTNSMILHNIQGECHRNAETSLDMYNIMREIRELLYEQTKHMAELTSSMKDLTEVVASNAMKSSSVSTSEPSNRSHGSGAIYYHFGTRLNGRYTAYACIIYHLIKMVYAHMESQALKYPDSTDCDFNELVMATQTVCKENCTIRTITYSIPIEMPTKKKQVAIESMYRHIGLTSQSGGATVPESNISKIYNDSTREDVFVKIGRIMERLTYLPGIVSPKQIDAMKSIQYPIAVARDDEPLRLNIDPKYWKTGSSHPISNNVMQLSHTGKVAYIQQIMAGKSPPTAYGIAVDSVSPKKQK